MQRLVCAVMLCVTLCLGVTGCSEAATPSTGSSPAGSSSTGSAATESAATFRNLDLDCDLEHVGQIDLSYATAFTIDEYAGGYRLICLASGDRFLVVPEGATVPDGLASDIAPIQQPVDNLYLVSTGMICLLDELDALDAVTVASVTADDCPNEQLAAALEAGEVAYGGRYRTPDYELIASEGCTLAIENTMVNRYPDAIAKLKELGVTVLVEQSSTEDTVLGRLEWIRLMGVIFGREELADAYFEEAVQRVEASAEQQSTGKTVAVFYIDENGAAVVRRAGDYFHQMIELAGGACIAFDPEDESGSSRTTYFTVEMERFYAEAKDADVIIYNATMDERATTLDDLVAKNPLLADFKAVQTGEVYICDSNMYQQMTSTPDIIDELHATLEGTQDNGRFIWRLE